MVRQTYAQVGAFICYEVNKYIANKYKANKDLLTIRHIIYRRVSYLKSQIITLIYILFLLNFIIFIFVDNIKQIM